MKRSACERLLVAGLESPLRDLGFQTDGVLAYLRTTQFGGQTLRFGIRLEPDGTCRIGGTAGIRFREIQAILEHFETGGGDLTPTVVMPFHLLHADRRHFEWSLPSPEETPRVCSEILREVETSALPFFDRFSTLDAFAATLNEPTPSSWFILTPEQREATLAAIDHLAGATSSAVARLDRAIAERLEKPPKYRRNLEKLRDFLSSSPVGPG